MTTYLHNGVIAYESDHILQEEEKKKALLGELFQSSEHRKSVSLIIAMGNFRPPGMTRESIFLVRL